MSATPCLLLLLLCISLSLHACPGRRLAVLASNQKHQKNVPSSNLQNDQKEMSATGLETNSSSSERGLATKGNRVETNHLGDDTRQMIKDPSLAKQKQTTRESSKQSGAVQKSVTWRVPQNKHREKLPGFNLDYAPPKTHPPSHN